MFAPTFLTRLLLLQLKNGSRIRLEPLSASLVRSVAAVTSQASIAPVTMAPGGGGGGDDAFHPGKSAAVPYIPAQQQAPGSTGVHQERAPRYFSLTQSRDPGHPEPELASSSPLLAESRERAVAPPEVPASPATHRQQGETEGWRERRQEEEEEEEAGERRRGGAREDSQGGSIQEKLHSSARDREDGPQHPQQSAEPALWRGESGPLPSWRAADRDSREGRERGGGGGGEGGRGKGGHLREAAQAHGSSAQEQERSGGRSQEGISGRRCLGLRQK